VRSQQNINPFFEGKNWSPLQTSARICVHNDTQIKIKNEMVERIGVREFRNNLAKYIDGASPVAVMRHGQTVGYFIPAHQEPVKAELEALKQAAAKLDALLAEQGISEDELVQEFRQLRENQA
jgi:antitoxin (DNA-binding transcriptional repressor) of toxin-antitoxin stability system